MSNQCRRDIANFWLSFQFGGVYRWKTLSHNGVLFPPEYKHKGVSVSYNGEDIILDKDAEEAAFLYARYIGTDYVTNSTFNKNFWKDWKQILGKGHKIKSLDGCDFTAMKEYLEANKGKKEKIDNVDEDKYKIAMVDGVEQPVGNFRMEPPGIFMGRGKNPNLGRIKKRIHPEDVIINIGKGEPIPEPIPGRKWKKVIHDRSVVWLASWKDTIYGKTKYLWLGAHSDIKAESDKQKFDIARKLKKKVKRIREANFKNLLSDDITVRQTATAFYLIDKLALRVGNEKGSDEADTVGVTSLRVEHIELNGNDKITLDFLGKDSIRYRNTIKIDNDIYRNLQEFTNTKNKYDNIFDRVSSNDINRYLQEFMKDLTAKVFRTYNASYLFQKELLKISKKYEGKDVTKAILLDEFSMANAKVAIVMNHQKNVAKGYKGQIDNINKQIRKLRTQIKKAKESKKKNPDKIAKLEEKLKEKKSKKDTKMYMKNVSLETSKANYIDPRITVAFLKRHNIQPKDVFSSTLRQKFKWAFDAEKDYIF